jgi:hypothetical protein
MDKYLALLLQGSNRASYRERPIETMNTVNKLSTKGKKQALDNKLEKQVKHDEKNPERVKISAARRKAGAKAFKEQVKTFDSASNKLRDRIKSLKDRGAPLADIKKAEDDYLKNFDNEAKYDKIMKDAEKYKNEPLKFLAKQQEAKEFLKANEPSLGDIQRELSTISKALPSGLSAIEQLLKSKTSPEQLLQANAQFQRLNAKDRNAVLKELKQKTKGDVGARNALVAEFLQKSPEEQNQFLESLSAGIPIKLTIAEEEKQKAGRPKNVEPLEEQVIRDAVNRTRYDSREQEDYVQQNIFAQPNRTQAEIQASIRLLKEQYNVFKQKPTDILFREAADEKKNDAEVDEVTAQAVDKSAVIEAVDESVPINNDPEDEPLVQAVQTQLEADGANPQDAADDASEAVGATNAEVNLTQPSGRASPTGDLTLPESRREQLVNEILLKFGNTPYFNNNVKRDNDSVKLYKLMEKSNDSQLEDILKQGDIRDNLFTLPNSSEEELKVIRPLFAEEFIKANDKERKRQQNVFRKPEAQAQASGRASPTGDLTLQQKKNMGYPVITSNEIDELNDPDTAADRKYELQYERITQADIARDQAQQGITVNLPRIVESNSKIRKLDKAELDSLAASYNFNVDSLANKGDKVNALLAEKERREKQGQGFKPLDTGKGFRPLSTFPHHVVAGALSKHINRVRANRLRTNMNKHAVMNNVVTAEYNSKLKQHLLQGGDFGSWFMKGLTAPFALAAKINPIFGFGVPQISNALGLPTLF